MPVLLIAAFASGQADTTSIRSQEAALTTAIRTRDKAALTLLTDANLHVSWDCGSVVKNFHAELSRDEWLDDVSRLKINSYLTKISKIHFTARGPLKYDTAAQADVAEHLQIRLPQGRGTLNKNLIATDAWVKRGSTWKLAVRIYRTVPCQDGPQLVFPPN